MSEPMKIPVRRTEWALPNSCFQNAERMANEQGGEVVYGWMVEDHTLYVRHAHHAVWQDREGQLWEVTPMWEKDIDPLHALCCWRDIAFLPDPDAEYDETCLPTKYMPLVNDANVRKACECLDASQSAGEWESFRYWMGRAEALLNRSYRRLGRKIVIDPSRSLWDAWHKSVA